MTLEEIINGDKHLLTPEDVAPVLGVHPYTICVKARNGTLEFPYFRSGNRTKIPRIPFLIWLGCWPDAQKRTADGANAMRFLR